MLAHHRRSLTLLVGSLALLAACGDDDDGPTGPETRTFSATNVAVSNTILPAGRCAPALTLSITGEGQSNMGAITIEQSHCFTSDDPLTFFDGEFTNTFENGDSFHGTYAGSATPIVTNRGLVRGPSFQFGEFSLFSINGEWEVDGGTGSMAGVSGSGTAEGEVNLDNGSGTVSLTGTLRM